MSAVGYQYQHRQRNMQIISLHHFRSKNENFKKKICRNDSSCFPFTWLHQVMSSFIVHLFGILRLIWHVLDTSFILNALFPVPLVLAQFHHPSPFLLSCQVWGGLRTLAIRSLVRKHRIHIHIEQSTHQNISTCQLTVQMISKNSQHALIAAMEPPRVDNELIALFQFDCDCISIVTRGSSRKLRYWILYVSKCRFLNWSLAFVGLLYTFGHPQFREGIHFVRQQFPLMFILLLQWQIKK